MQMWMFKRCGTSDTFDVRYRPTEYEVGKLAIELKVEISSTILAGSYYAIPRQCDIAVGAILGQKDGKNFHPIYFASKTLNAAQQNYTITEKELMAVVFAFDKFQSYMVLSKMIVKTDHSTLRHLFKKQDAKPRLIR
ncbi:reverse transcriptase domain-containing protein [Tanacetum coccineum]